MSSFLIFLPLAVLVVALQATVVERFDLVGGHPDLVIVSLILWTMQSGRNGAILPAVIMAILFDSISGLPLGASVLPLLSVVFIAGVGERSLFGARLGWPVIIAFGATLLAGVITLVEMALLGWIVQWTDAFLRILLPSALLNAILILAFYIPVEYVRERRKLGFE